jgi:hypothetical protein
MSKLDCAWLMVADGSDPIVAVGSALLTAQPLENLAPLSADRGAVSVAHVPTQDAKLKIISFFSRRTS